MTENIDSYIPQLVLTYDVRRNIMTDQFEGIFSQIGFASVIIYDSQNDELFLQKKAEEIIHDMQKHGSAVLIANDSRVAGRMKADGVHIEGRYSDLSDMIERHGEKLIIGYGNLRDRHSAMEAGEIEPAYLFFGKLNADRKPEPHARNLSLAQWWSQLMEIPAIVQAGNNIHFFKKTLQTGAEFVAMEDMIFNNKEFSSIAKQINQSIEEFKETSGDNA